MLQGNLLFFGDGLHIKRVKVPKRVIFLLKECVCGGSRNVMGSKKSHEVGNKNSYVKKSEE